MTQRQFPYLAINVLPYVFKKGLGDIDRPTIDDEMKFLDHRRDFPLWPSFNGRRFGLWYLLWLDRPSWRRPYISMSRGIVGNARNRHHRKPTPAHFLARSFLFLENRGSPSLRFGVCCLDLCFWLTWPKSPFCVSKPEHAIRHEAKKRGQDGEPPAPTIYRANEAGDRHQSEADQNRRRVWINGIEPTAPCHMGFVHSTRLLLAVDQIQETPHAARCSGRRYGG